MAAEIVMADGTTKFVTIPTTDAKSLVEKFEQLSFAEVHLQGEVVYINPAHVAYLREV